jgi:RND superfamily putative drug exporter
MSLAKLLHTLGATAFKHPWQVVAGWAGVLVILGVGAAQFYQAPSSNISIPGTQAQQAIDRVGELFPDSGGASGRLVFHVKDGTIQDQKVSIENLVKEIDDTEGVTRAISPFIDESFISKDGTIAYSEVQFDGQIGSIKESTSDEVNRLVTETRTDDLQIEVGGDVLQQVPEIIGTGEIIGVAVALMVLIITLGSLVAGGMPLVSALVAIGVSMAGVFALSQVIEVNSTTPVLAIMLGLAVGIDYSLFIVNKYRRYVQQGYSNQDAIARSLGTAGNAVVFAAITVIIALAALSIVQIPFMTTMGLVGAASIAVSAVVALTLTPALMAIVGNRIFRKKERAKIKPMKNVLPGASLKVDRNTFWYKWGKVIASYPVVAIVITLVVAGVVALPAKDLKLGLPSDQYAPASSTERKAYDLLSQGFGQGFNAPLTVVVDGLPKVSEADKQLVRAQALAEFNTRVAEETKKQQAAFEQRLTQASSPQELQELQQKAQIAQIEGEKQKNAALAEIERNVNQYAKYVQLTKLANGVKELDNVQQVTPALVADDGSVGVIQVIPFTAPDDDKTRALIAKLRDESTQNGLSGKQDVSLSVTGTVALQDDINNKLAEALPLYLAVIVGLSLVLLIIAFRSILVPLKATLGFLLSVLAMFGATVAVFQWGWFGITDAPGPIVSFIPIIATGILFGLAMDYEFFLVSGIHESYSMNKDSKQSVITGFGAGSKVVTAAAVIMISVFAGFITSHEAVIQSIGFGLAVGILIDAFLIRMTLVPAAMVLLGKSAWWLPNWLDKRLPHVSIEGEAEK